MVTPTNNNTTTTTTLPMEQEPTYTCEVCNTPMVYSDIRHTHTPTDNSRPMYFCTVGCYYVWADNIPEADPEDYR